VLLGAVGGPKWDNPQSAVRPEQALLGLRRGLGLFANLRPIVAHPALLGAAPLGLPVSETRYIEADPEEYLALGKGES